jgi:hypothetical protein
MRLIQLRLDNDALDLHPMMTVITGLDTAARARVIATVSALPHAGDPGTGGLVESHGVLFDLSVETLELFGLGADLDPVVRASDLPGGSQGGGRIPRLTAEQFLVAAPEGRFADLDTARTRQRSSRETLSILRESVERTRREHADVAAKARRAEAALVAALDGGSAASTTSTEPVDRDELIEQIAQHEERQARLDRGISELTALDTRPTEVLLEAIRNPAPVEFVPSERAAELADEFAALKRHVDELEQGMESEGRGTAGALHRLENARTELAQAERAMLKPNLSADDVTELEAAHAAVFEAESKMSGIRKRGGQKRFDDAMAAEQIILDRVGFPTWSSYIMGAGLLAIDPLAERRLERAHAEVAAAEAHWATVAAEIESNPEHRAMLDRLEDVYLEAFDLLGGDDDQEDLEEALRDLKVPNREVTAEELVDALAYQLELVGLDLGPDPGIDRTLMAADAFLGEVQALSARVAELRVERAGVDHELATARHALEQAEVASSPAIDLTDGAVDAGADDEPTLDTLAAERDAAMTDEVDYADSLEARLALVDAATQVEAVATSRLMRIAAELAEAQVTAGPSPSSDPAVGVHSTEDDVGPESIEFYLLARLAAQRNVSFSGSVPMVLDDALLGLGTEQVHSLLNKLERMSEAVQILYLSDEPAVAEWANSVGLTHAAVVPLPRQYA